MRDVPPFQLQPDQRSWRERARKDKRIRVRDRKAYVRPDNDNRPTHQRVRDRTVYARPGKGKRPKHHSGGHNKKQRVVVDVSNRKYMELKAAIASPLDGQLASLSTAAEEDTETRDRCNRPKSHSGQKKTMPEPIAKQEQEYNS